ncbi:hypothetical protein [Shinella sp. JR1-6]|uniref:hypothetical protein n=1 Tax=Shinella sp. JR1-6 TaxID=2527671 RepID=UPI00102D487B|nr:hypothetical protein [Shinella sp. JR1-6]TAA49052.1 hypothetical protein EXZ48_34585 [Shinella sp. JR1-6]
MTTSDNISAIEAIEKAMEGVTPGPWREGTEGNQRVYGPDGMGEHSGLIANIFKGRANTRYIAACNPVVMSAILAEARKVEEMEREIADLRDSLSDVLELAERQWANPEELSEIRRARALLSKESADADR